MRPTPVITSLYVPADRPDRFDKAIASGADAVILDLEDAVAPAHKVQARREAVEYLAGGPESIVVRINGSDTAWHDADIDALAGCTSLSGVRLPKVETADEVQRVAERLPGIPVHALIESALGVENLSEIARAPGVAGISLGEADLRSALAISDPYGLDWIRSRIVIAARAAGLPPPMVSVWADVADLDGLTEALRRGRSRGFFGGVAIHPAQVPVIRSAFLPDDAEIDRAKEVLAALSDAETAGSGVAVLPGRRMVDAAMREAAERTMSLARFRSQEK